MWYVAVKAFCTSYQPNLDYFRSGDLGTVDESGFLTIVGRLKELLVTAGGKNVAPVPIEMRIKKALPDIVSNAVVIGEGRKFLSCLLTLKLTPDQVFILRRLLAQKYGNMPRQHSSAMN